MRAAVPRLARWILRSVAPAQHRDAILSDLEDEAAERAATSGIPAARRWSTRQAVDSIVPLLAERGHTTLSTIRSTRMSAWRGFRTDLTLAVRRLLQAPGFTLVCVLTLALGIGGNTAVFTLIDQVMLKPLPVPRPNELYRVGDTDACCVNSGLMGSFSLFSYDLYTHLRDAAPEFSQLAAFQANVRAITIGRSDPGTPAETLNGAFVSGNYFQMFELVPAAGRLMQPSDDTRGATPAAVLSYRAWTDRFQGRPGVIGSSVTLNGVQASIVGVAPEGFYGDMLRPNPPEIWVALAAEPLLQPAARLLETKRSHWLYAIGRLRPGTDLPPLNARLTATLQNWITANLELPAESRGEVPRQTINVIPAAKGVSNMRDEVTPALRLLQALAAAVLLVACANLANLLLARSMARRTETAVRVALGATRSRLVLQFLVESVLLACAGGLAGLLVAYLAAGAIVDLAFRGSTDVPVDATPSLLVMGFAFGMSLLTGLIFGVAPAIIGSRSDPIDAMRGAGRTTGEGGTRMRQSLIVVQVAMSLVLVTCAGLLGRSLQQLEAQDFGFQIDGRYVVSLAPSLSMVPGEQMESIYARMRERVKQVPGVLNAGYSLYAPMSGDNWASNIMVDGRATTEQAVASWNRVSPGYFETVGTPVVRGRGFDERDRPGAPLVAIVSLAFAREFFGDSDPIGRRIGFVNSTGVGNPDYEVVGVVGDAKYQDGRRPPYVTFFLPFLQQTAAARNASTGVKLDRSHYAQALEVHTAGRLPAIESEVRRALADVDRRITVRTVMPMHEQVATAFNLERLIARLTVAFGGVALLLACLGLYGVTAYSVTRRTREIGIRMAVGASAGRVLRTVLRGAIGQLIVGVALGLPAAFAAGRLLQSQLFGVSGHDPRILIGGLALLGASTIVAAWVPARRAARLNPVQALRND
jgi:predicted permease